MLESPALAEGACAVAGGGVSLCFHDSIDEARTALGRDAVGRILSIDYDPHGACECSESGRVATSSEALIEMLREMGDEQCLDVIVRFHSNDVQAAVLGYLSRQIMCGTSFSLVGADSALRARLRSIYKGQNACLRESGATPAVSLPHPSWDTLVSLR